MYTSWNPRVHTEIEECELKTAVRSGNTDEVYALLNRDLFYNIPAWHEGQGINLLGDAISLGHCDIAELLIRKGARVNNKYGNPTNDPLHLAASIQNNQDLVTLLLSEGAKINNPNADGETPLHLAVSWNNEEMVKLLLQNNAETNSEDDMRNTPLHVAARKGLTKIADMLLAHGAQANLSMYGGYTPLHLACLLAHYDTVVLLIKHTKDINTVSREGTPLDLSVSLNTPFTCEEQRTLIVDELLKAGAQVNAFDNDGKTVLHRAVEKNCPDMVKTILKYANINTLSFDIPGKCLQTPLQIAAQLGHAEVIDLLISNGADLNLSFNTDLGGAGAPLHLACRYGHIDAVKAILKHKVDADVKTLEGRTPLHFAVCHVNNNFDKLLQLIKLLTNSGAKLYTLDSNNSTILHTAVEMKSLPLVELIFQFISSNSTDPNRYLNSQNSQGFTPLHIAAIEGSRELVQFLLDQGADINSMANYDGYTPLHVASKHIHFEVIRLLISRGASANSLSFSNQTPAHVLLMFCDESRHICLTTILSCLDILLENGTDIDCVDKYDNTILNLGVKPGFLKIIEVILKNNPDPLNIFNKSALCTAVVSELKYSVQQFNKRIEPDSEYQNIIFALQKYGLTFNDIDVANQNVLHHAIRKGYITVVQYLCNNGADVNELSDRGRPLHSAVGTLQEDVVKLLIDLGANVNYTDKDGKMPIHIITKKLDNTTNLDVERCFSIATQLLSKGANLSNDSEFLIVATHRGSRPLVKMAIKCCANVNATGSNGMTPIHAAVYAKDMYLVKLLIENGAVIDAVDNVQQTPLHIALTQREEAIVHHLLKNGANVNVVDQYYYSPLHYAAIWGNCSLVKTLLDFGAEIDSMTNKDVTPLHLAAELGRGKTVITLLQHGANANTKRDDKVTALHMAAKWADESVVEHLLYYGADPKARTANNVTPLGYSLQVCHPQVLRLLLENGGYTFDMCCSMCQAVQWFDDRKWDGHSEMFNILHFHFLSLEALQMWPSVHLCQCQQWFRNEIVKGDIDGELEQLKCRMIVKGVHAYDIISKSKHQLVSLARNLSVLEVLKDVDFLKEYPIFGGLMQHRWESAVDRESLLSLCLTSFNSLIIGNIISAIDNSSKNLIDTLSNHQFSWLLYFLNLNNKESNVSQLSSKQHFILYLKQIHSLLPITIVEKIISHLSDSDLKNLSNSCPLNNSI